VLRRFFPSYKKIRVYQCPFVVRFSFPKIPLLSEPIAKLSGNVAQSPSAVVNLPHFQCFSYDLPSRGRPGYISAIGSLVLRFQSQRTSYAVEVVQIVVFHDDTPAVFGSAWQDGYPRANPFG